MPIDFAAVDAALISAQPILAVTLYPAAGLLALVFGAEFHRLGDENVHDVSDYQPDGQPLLKPMENRERRRLRGGYRSAVAAGRRNWPLVDRHADAPATLLAPYAASVVSLVARRYGDSPTDIAARWLREIAAEQRADDIVWTSTADRDLTGVFPVVAVAR